MDWVATFRWTRWQYSPGLRGNIPLDWVAKIRGIRMGVVVGSMRGLLAFVLALTLSFASTRFHERQTGTLAEANAIGTAWLRAKAMSHVRGGAIAHLLEEYARIRRDFVRARAGSVRCPGAEPTYHGVAIAHLGTRGGDRARGADHGFYSPDGGTQRDV